MEIAYTSNKLEQAEKIIGEMTEQFNELKEKYDNIMVKC